MSGLPEIVDAQHASKEQQEEKHSLGYFSKCIKDAIEGSLRTQEYIGDPELESTWVVDDVLLESKSAKSSTSDASTNDSESQWYMEKKKPKQLIQIVAYQLRNQLSSEVLLEILCANPSILNVLFKPLLENIQTIPVDGDDALVTAHVWLIALIRATNSIKFLTSSFAAATEKKQDPEDMLYADNWLLLMCEIGMYRTLKFALSHDKDGVLLKQWGKMLDISDKFGGPLGRACCGSINVPMDTRAALTAKFVKRVFTKCMEQEEFEKQRNLSTKWLHFQYSGVALVTLAREIDNSMVALRVLTRLLEWCPDILVDIMDHEGYTALAHIVRKGGSPLLAEKLVKAGASLLVTIMEDVQQKETPSKSFSSSSNDSKVPSGGNKSIDKSDGASDCPKATREEKQKQLQMTLYKEERVLLRRLIMDPKCKVELRTRRLAVYRRAWNVKQQELTDMLRDIVRHNLKHEPLDMSINSPQLRVFVTNLAVTPRESDCTYALSSGSSSSSIARQNTLDIPMEEHRRQLAKVVKGAELIGLHAGRIYNQYELEPNEGWLSRAPTITSIIPGMMLQVQIVMQNGNSIDCVTPSTVLVTLFGSGDPLDPYLPNFSTTTLVFHTQNYLSYCGLSDPVYDEVHEEGHNTHAGLGHEMYKLSNHASHFYPEQVASGAAAMPFHLTMGALQFEEKKKSPGFAPPDMKKRVDPSQFVEILHWEQDPAPQHLVIGRMNIASAVAPFNIELEEEGDSQEEESATSLSKSATSDAASSADRKKKTIKSALKFQTLIFTITIISRRASDIMLKEQQLQEDFRLEEVYRQEQLESNVLGGDDNVDENDEE
jgi:hypothetical protein